METELMQSACCVMGIGGFVVFFLVAVLLWTIMEK